MEKIKIAVDSCVITALSQISSKNLSPEDKAVRACLKNRTLNPGLYRSVPYEFLPPLLKDRYLGAIIKGDNGESYYTNLINIYDLWVKVERGQVELYITPTVAGELDFEWLEEQKEFINKYVNVIRIEKGEKQFYRERNALARTYVQYGAMKECYSACEHKKVPQNDAYIMAEASLCGLALVTANSKDFINYNNYDEDYKRTNIIQQVNKDNGLMFASNLPNIKIAPYPMSVTSFAMKSRFTDGMQQKAYYIPKPKVYGKVYQPTPKLESDKTL